MELTLRARAPLKLSLEDVVRALLAAAEGTPLEANARARAPGPNGPFIIDLHPIVGSAEIRANGDHVEFEARAYTVGPGYHAFLVSALDSMQASLGLRWEWLDETGYAQRRDFADLQSKIAEAFRRTCVSRVAQIRASGDATGTRVFLPASFRVVAAKDEIFTPFGPTTLKQLEQWASLDGAELRKAAAGFYLWWDQGFGGSFYRGVVLYWLWMDIRWATPIEKEEGDFIIGTLDCYSKALEHRADLPIPESAITELFALVEGKVSRPVADPQGIGYRRRMWTRPIGRNWRLTMPGSLDPSEEDKDGRVTYVFDSDRLNVRASVYLAPSDDPDIRAGAFDGEISLVERHVEELDRTFVVRSLGKTFSLGERTSVCFLTITSSTPEMHVLGQRIGQSLTYEPEG